MHLFLLLIQSHKPFRLLNDVTAHFGKILNYMVNIVDSVSTLRLSLSSWFHLNSSIRPTNLKRFSSSYQCHIYIVIRIEKTHTQNAMRMDHFINSIHYVLYVMTSWCQIPLNTILFLFIKVMQYNLNIITIKMTSFECVYTCE